MSEKNVNLKKNVHILYSWPKKEKKSKNIYITDIQKKIFAKQA